MAQDAKLINVKPLAKAIYSDVGQTEVNRRAVQVWGSDKVKYTDTTTVNVFSLPGNVLVTGGFINIVEAFDASDADSLAATLTLSIPVDTGTLTIYDAGNAGLCTTGLFPCTDIGITPSSGGLAIVTYTPQTTNAHGSFYVYLEIVDPAPAHD